MPYDAPLEAELPAVDVDDPVQEALDQLLRWRRAGMEGSKILSAMGCRRRPRGVARDWADALRMAIKIAEDQANERKMGG